MLKILVKTGKCSLKLLHSAKKSTTDVIKTASKKAIQTTADTTGDLIGNKITKASSQNSLKTKLNEEIPSDRYISPEKRQQIINELRLI